MPDGSSTPHYPTDGFIPSIRPRSRGDFVPTTRRQPSAATIFRPLTPAAMVVDHIPVQKATLAATLFATAGSPGDSASSSFGETDAGSTDVVPTRAAAEAIPETPRKSLPGPLGSAIAPAADLARLAVPAPFNTRTWEQGWEEGLRAGREEGILQGRIEGVAATRDELSAEAKSQAESAAALAAALAALNRPAPGSADDLAKALNRAIARLAADRAGMAIDANPEGFARRIARLAERVGIHRAEMTLHLHPADRRALTSLMEKSANAELAALAGARLVADPALLRGDADLRAPGVRIADLLDAQEACGTETP